MRSVCPVGMTNPWSFLRQVCFLARRSVKVHEEPLKFNYTLDNPSHQEGAYYNHGSALSHLNLRVRYDVRAAGASPRTGPTASAVG